MKLQYTVYKRTVVRTAVVRRCTSGIRRLSFRGFPRRLTVNALFLRTPRLFVLPHGFRYLRVLLRIPVLRQIPCTVCALARLRLGLLLEICNLLEIRDAQLHGQIRIAPCVSIFRSLPERRNPSGQIRQCSVFFRAVLPGYKRYRLLNHPHIPYIRLRERFFSLICSIAQMKHGLFREVAEYCREQQVLIILRPAHQFRV